MPVDPDLVTRLERSLQAQASDVTPAPRAFDPDADLCFPDLGVEGHGRRRSMAR